MLTVRGIPTFLQTKNEKSPRQSDEILWRQLLTPMAQQFDQLQPAKNVSQTKDSGAHTAYTPASSSGGLVGEYLNSTTPLVKGTAALKPEQDWTVAVDLSILYGQNGPRGVLGSEDKEKMLEEIVAKTKGSPVSIVVQSIVSTGKTDKPYALERRVLKDGVVGPATLEASHGESADLERLVSIAADDEPSQRIALVLNAHGLGDEGLSGGTSSLKNGHADLADLTKAIQSGLRGSNHDKLDMLDLDSCVMGQMGVANKMSAITDHLIASELPERVISNDQGTKSVDSQNLAAWIDDLAKNPSIDGFQLSEYVVAEAQRGANAKSFAGVPGLTGTPSLAHYELGPERIDFMNAMNELGNVLTAVVATDDGRKLVDSLIDHVPNLAGVDHMGNPVRGSDEVTKNDLDQFIVQLKLLNSTPQLRGEAEKLKTAIEGVEVAQHAMEPSSYVDMSKEDKLISDFSFGNTSLGGLSVFLPNQGERRVELPSKTADLLNPAPKQKRTYDQLVNLELPDADNQATDGWRGFLLALKESK
jgi:Clostripain family